MRWVAIVALVSLVGCTDKQAREHYANLEKARAEREVQAVYKRCLFEAKGYFGTASIEVIRHCEARALEARKP